MCGNSSILTGLLHPRCCDNLTRPVSADPMWVHSPYWLTLSRGGSSPGSRRRWSDSFCVMSVSQASCVLCSPFRHSFRNFLLWSSRIMYKRAFKNKIGSIPLPELQWRQQECWPCPGYGRGRKGGLSLGRHGLWHRSLCPLGHVIGLKHASESTRICQWFPLSVLGRIYGCSQAALRKAWGRHPEPTVPHWWA